ncbi:hypothetical protein [Kribbella sp. NPDC051770]|uniref:hypothetical protein n=1 Tax=Kribbella sp. NPDC051770 TaxID=3155413 RepID=UPI003429CD29
MSVHELLPRLPDVATVRRISRALAVLDLIVCEDPAYRYYSFDARWSETEEAALMVDGSGDEFSIVFAPEGVFARGFAHESEMSPYGNNGELWPGLLDGVPDVLHAARDEPAFRDAEDGLLNATVAFWRTPADDRWVSGPVAPSGDDGAERLFGVLTEGPDGYLPLAEDRYEVALDLDAIRHVYALMPLTEYVVTLLNRNRKLADLKEDLAEIGYPREF